MEIPHLKELAIIILTLLILYEVRSYLMGCASKKWRKRVGKVQTVFVKTREYHDDGDYKEESSPKVKYVYSVSNTQYVSSRYAYGNLWFRDYGDAALKVSGINVGQKVDVYINPRNPRQSVLVTGYVGNFLINLIILFVVLLAAITS